jgi:hypothetical protein
MKGPLPRNLKILSYILYVLSVLYSEFIHVWWETVLNSYQTHSVTCHTQVPGQNIEVVSVRM